MYVFIIIKIIKYLCIIDICLDLNFFYKRDFYKYDVLIVCFYNVKFEWFLIKKNLIDYYVLKICVKLKRNK